MSGLLPRQLVVTGLLGPEETAALARVTARLPERHRLTPDRVMEAAPYTPWEALRACLLAVDGRPTLRLLGVSPAAARAVAPKKKGSRFMRGAKA